MPKCRGSKVLKLRNAKTLKRRRFWDCEKLRSGKTLNAEPPKLRNAEAPKRRDATGSGGGSAVAVQDPECANLVNSSPEWGQQPGEEVNLGRVRRKGLYVLSLPADWPVWPQASSKRDREWQNLWRGFDLLRPWQGGGGGGDERERAEVKASMVPSEVVRSEGGAEGSRGCVEASRRPGSHMGEFQGLWGQSGILVQRKGSGGLGSYPEVLGGVRRYRKECGGIGRHAEWECGSSAGYIQCCTALKLQEQNVDTMYQPRILRAAKSLFETRDQYGHWDTPKWLPASGHVDAAAGSTWTLIKQLGAPAGLQKYASQTPALEFGWYPPNP
ncbi:hypothetical protein GGX14DRAFT_583184 [Mycena pura]|uniref:Uncharacterized protein n=1 Tax=Mycena pura TaxID=153505 RepID=A0AAD6YVP0_9AGAR|nr:hypothetical protein GGX14DRAFT_583184 [Mycena pura]